MRSLVFINLEKKNLLVPKENYPEEKWNEADPGAWPCWYSTKLDVFKHREFLRGQDSHMIYFTLEPLALEVSFP